MIAELLRFLKRSYWPFAWDSSAAGGSSTGVHSCHPPNQLPKDGISQCQTAANPSSAPQPGCSTQCDHHLERAHRIGCCPLDPSRAAGGFTDAALCLLEGAESAELQAISRVAEHRLARGIWTSPGAGDLRRALAAAQRLAILVTAPLLSVRAAFRQPDACCPVLVLDSGCVVYAMPAGRCTPFIAAAAQVLANRAHV